MADIPLTMPKMSMTMEEGTLTEWHVAEGDVIAKGDVVAVVMTDKVDMEVESPAAGTVTQLLCAEGDVVPVGGQIAIVASEEDDLLGDLFSGGGGGAGADAAEGPASAGADGSGAETSGGIDTAAGPGASAAPDSPAGPSGSAEAAGAASGDGPSAVAPDGPLPPSVPLARKLARDHGLDLRTITPTGPHGTVRVKDVKEAIAASGAQRQDGAGAGTAPADSTVPASGASAAAAAPVAPVVEAAPEELLGTARERRTRQLTAQAMSATPLIPQFTAFRRMDLSVAARARTGVLKGVSWTTLLLRAYAMLLRGNEQLNGSWAGTGVKRNPTVDVVLAVDTPGGLLVPVLREPDQVSVRDLDAQVRSIAASAKEGKVDPSLFGPATGTLSNLGGLGVDRFNSLITPPQATALSVGAVTTAPVVEADGTLGARMTCELGLTIDHRVADGADAARALQTIQDLLDDPLRLAL